MRKVAPRPLRINLKSLLFKLLAVRRNKPLNKVQNEIKSLQKHVHRLDMTLDALGIKMYSQPPTPSSVQSSSASPEVVPLADPLPEPSSEPLVVEPPVVEPSVSLISPL
ncbi:hypothetical protein K1719_038119 [Acacia pycnantha]|nr:hypothetical protein K1719_038119 [Acacia pycnantha]